MPVHLAHAPSDHIMSVGRKQIPLILHVWFLLLFFWMLSYTSYTGFFRGFRFVHSFYYIEFLFPSALFIISLKPKRVKIPSLIWLWGGVLILMAIVGLLKGNFPSLIYDRGRNWGGMVFLLMLLYRYQITSDQLMKLLKPVLFSAMIGYPLVVIFPMVNDAGLVSVQDTLGFNLMAAAYALGCILVIRTFSWWHFWAISAAPIVPVLLAARAKFLAMIIGMFLPTIRIGFRRFFRTIFILIMLTLLVGSVTYFVNPAEQSEGKSIKAGGLDIESLAPSSIIRILEFSAILDQMKGIDYLFGKGSGSTWDGIAIYGDGGEARQIFHIYYLEIFYFYGTLGLILWFFVGVLPVVKGFFYFHRLNEVGVMGLISQSSLLFAWFGHAGYSITEGSFMAIALYALHIGKK